MCDESAPKLVGLEEQLALAHAYNVSLKKENTALIAVYKDNVSLRAQIATIKKQNAKLSKIDRMVRDYVAENMPYDAACELPSEETQLGKMAERLTYMHEAYTIGTQNYDAGYGWLKSLHGEEVAELTRRLDKVTSQLAVAKANSKKRARGVKTEDDEEDSDADA